MFSQTQEKHPLSSLKTHISQTDDSRSKSQGHTHRHPRAHPRPRPPPAPTTITHHHHHHQTTSPTDHRNHPQPSPTTHRPPQPETDTHTHTHSFLKKRRGNTRPLYSLEGRRIPSTHRKGHPPPFQGDPVPFQRKEGSPPHKGHTQTHTMLVLRACVGMCVWACGRGPCVRVRACFFETTLNAVGWPILPFPRTSPTFPISFTM